ncbi:MAG: hypothetical protein M3Q44_07520 [bacterium]|nr:hypothetical protein [bacterium]
MANRGENKTIKILVGGVIVTAIIVGGVYFLNNSNNRSNASNSGNSGQVAGLTSNNKQAANNPKVILNKTYSTIALDVTGKPSKNKIDVIIKSAEKSQDILIKGQPATAKNGSAFLVLQVDLKNASNERLIISPLNLLRLIVDGQKRAAEIYTEEVPQIRGSVVVEPDSTKVTRVGFVLTSDIVSKAFKLQIGDVNATDKTTIDLKF